MGLIHATKVPLGARRVAILRSIQRAVQVRPRPLPPPCNALHTTLPMCHPGCDSEGSASSPASEVSSLKGCCKSAGKSTTFLKDKGTLGTLHRHPRCPKPASPDTLTRFKGLKGPASRAAPARQECAARRRHTSAAVTRQPAADSSEALCAEPLGCTPVHAAARAPRCSAARVPHVVVSRKPVAPAA